MRIHHAVVVTAMAGALTLGAPAGPAAAATRGEANAKARAAANHYTNTRFGIGFNVPGGAGYWSARCSRVGSHWTCRVRMNGGQCTGSLKLSYRLLAYAYRIGCGE